MKNFKEWFQENYTHKSGLRPHDKMCAVVDEYAQEAVTSALQEAGEKIDTEIEKLQTSKQEYGELDDRYSWHIVDDEQTVNREQWKHI